MVHTYNIGNMLYDGSNSNNRSLAMGCEIEYAVRMEPVHELSTLIKCDSTVSSINVQYVDQPFDENHH